MLVRVMEFLGDSTLTELETVVRVESHQLSTSHGEIQPSQLPRHSQCTDEIRHLVVSYSQPQQPSRDGRGV